MKGVLERDQVHMFLSIPPKLSLSDVLHRIKGSSSHRIQMEFPELRKRYLSRRFWARGYFSTTSDNVTDHNIKQYLESHSSK
jgi:putative transposase